MVMAIGLVKGGRAQAVFSAGNTGAYVVSSRSMLEPIREVEKFGIAINLPTLTGRDLLLIDAGSSTDCAAKDLLVFARMGKIYAEEIMGRMNPTIGLVNIGEEPFKGNEVTRKAYELFKESGLNFTGNIEGNAIADGKHDVVICDGFIGNTILKVAEGSVGFVIGVMKSEFRKDWLSKLGAQILRPAFRRIKKRIDWKEWGGGVLLGPRGNVLIGHGRSDAKAIFNALRLADRMVKSEMWAKIERELAVSEA
jgi:glycerol-3-phosphate acyltransferase PlsX